LNVVVHLAKPLFLFFHWFDPVCTSLTVCLEHSRRTLLRLGEQQVYLQQQIFRAGNKICDLGGTQCSPKVAQHHQDAFFPVQHWRNGSSSVRRRRHITNGFASCVSFPSVCSVAETFRNQWVWNLVQVYIVS